MLIGQLSRVLLRSPYGDLNLIGGHIRDDNDTHCDQSYDTEHKQEDRKADRRQLEPQTESEGFLVHFLDCVHDPAVLREDVPENSAGSSRHDCHSDNQRGYKTVRNRQGHGNQKFSHSAAGKYHREEDADRRQRRCYDSTRDLLCSLYSRSRSCSISAAESENVLYDNDRVVYQHAYAK